MLLGKNISSLLKVIRIFFKEKVNTDTPKGRIWRRGRDKDSFDWMDGLSN